MLRRFFQTTFAFLVLFYLTGPVHEHGHQIAIALLGGASHMEYPLSPWGIAKGKVVYDVMIDDPSLLWISGLAGGLWAALFLWVFVALFARWTPTRSDTYVEFAAWMLAYSQLIYGIALEGVIEAGGPVWLLAFLIPPMAGMLFVMWRWLGWLAKGNER